MALSKDNGFEKTEKVTLQWFGEEIGEHFESGAVANGNVAGVNAVFEPEVTDVDVARFGAGRRAAIGGEVNRTLIVLLEDVARDCVALGLHEVFDPDGMGKVITGADGFGLSRAFSIEFLFGGFANQCSATERNSATSVTFEIGMDGVGSIDPCTEAAEVIGTKGEVVVEAARDVFQEATKFFEILLSGFCDPGGKETGGKEDVHAAAEGDVEEFSDDAMKNVA